jgi:phage-related protein
VAERATAARRRWRYYRTATGAQPVRQFLDSLEPVDRDAIRVAMSEAASGGRSLARHLRGDVYELRVAVRGRAWRLLFSAEGPRHHVLLALSSFEKKTQRTPLREVELAETRLRDWRERGRLLGP